MAGGYHPLVARDLDAIAHWFLDYAGPNAADSKLVDISSATNSAYDVGDAFSLPKGWGFAMQYNSDQNLNDA